MSHTVWYCKTSHLVCGYVCFSLCWCMCMWHRVATKAESIKKAQRAPRHIHTPTNTHASPQHTHTHTDQIPPTTTETRALCLLLFLHRNKRDLFTCTSITLLLFLMSLVQIWTKWLFNQFLFWWSNWKQFQSVSVLSLTFCPTITPQKILVNALK